MPDHECAGLPDFNGTSDYFFALFDPSEAGLWPIAVRMCGGTGAAGREPEWRALPNAPFQVSRPSGTLTYREWPTALEFAATYTTPF